MAEDSSNTFVLFSSKQAAEKGEILNYHLHDFCVIVLDPDLIPTSLDMKSRRKAFANKKRIGSIVLILQKSFGSGALLRLGLVVHRSMSMEAIIKNHVE